MLKNTRTIQILCLIFYGGITILGLLVHYLHTGTMRIPFFEHPVKSLVAAGLCAPSVILFSRISMRRCRWAKLLAREIADVLGRISLKEAFTLALVSGVSEEILFRGALLPWIGIVLSSLIFGIVHFPYTPRFIPWTVFALAMGFLLGGAALWSGDLLAPILIHSSINFHNLRSISNRAGEGCSQ
jgi:hypothetical protein